MPKILNGVGFVDNPFASYVAENEPQIEGYFVRPPYYAEVLSRGNECRSLVVFGARGAGKSATRLTFYKECWNKRAKDQKAPLVVTLDDFSRITAEGLEKADLGKFVAEVGYLAVEAVLAWLSGLEDEERILHVSTLTEEQEALAITLVQKFYLSRSELVRSSTVREPLKLLNQAWHKKTKLWIDKKWDPVVSLISVLANAFAKRVSGADLAIDGGLKALLQADQASWNDGHFARILLSRFSDFAKSFGFDGIVVLVDKVDETPLTNNSALATAKLLFPLLSTTQLLEIDDFSWIMFLWSNIKEGYSGSEQSIRLDKIAHATIIWQESFLIDLVNRRLSHFSNKKINSFSEICDPDLDWVHGLRDIVSISMKSPRDLIRILDTIIREHDEVYGGHDNIVLINRTSIDRALDRYVVEILPGIYNKKLLQQIVRMPNVAFTNSDVQNIFKINGNSARNRIRGWQDAGMVAKSGAGPAAGGQAGRPADEYLIIDQRLCRVIDAQLSLGPDFDISDDE